MFVVNQSNHLSKQLSVHSDNDFSSDESADAGYIAKGFIQAGFLFHWYSRSVLPEEHAAFTLQAIGKHNMENALAAACVANQLGVDLANMCCCIKNYEGIYRRHQVLGK